MTLNTTNFAFALKEMYPPDVMKDMTSENRPLLAMLDKDEKAGGKTITVPMIYANPQGRSATLSTAITNKGNTTGAEFSLTRVSDYAVASIDRETILASEGDKGAFAAAVETEMDGAVNNASNSLAKSLYRDGHGHIGQVSSVTTANPMVITLEDINDIANFEVGQVLVCDNTEAGSSLLATPASVTVDGIDRDLGTITTNFDNSGPTTDWDDAGSEYLFQSGDQGLMLSGLSAWVPSTAPSATTFFGVDRTADTTRLGGVRVTGTGMPVEQALHKLAAKVSREGGKPDCAYISDVQYHEMMLSLGSKVEYVEQGVTADVYFSGAVIHGPRGKIEVYPDHWCPSRRGYVLTKNTWKLYSLRGAPHIFDADNDQKLLRETTTDAYEVRVGYYAQLGCSAPGWNGVATLDAATF